METSDSAVRSKHS